MPAPVSPFRLKAELAAVSFIGLFLELMVIRWVPSVVHLVAYYANLMLLSSFLGLGLGAMLGPRRRDLFAWFPAFVAVALVTQWLCRGVRLTGTAAEVRFYAFDQAQITVIVLVAVFATNALLFVPLGQRLGRLFAALPPLEAYSWDLAGSLAGTLAFGWFSLRWFSPLMGLAVVGLLFAVLSSGAARWLALTGFAGLLAFLQLTGDRAIIWSPYYAITVYSIGAPEIHETVPPDDLRTRRDPPIYGVNVNQFGYHYDGAFDPARYSPGNPDGKLVASMATHYGFPFLLTPQRERVLVIGAGGGADVSVALLRGARHIDAVEIDPVVIDVSRRFNAGAPYLDPRVTLHVDDARSFLAHARPGYDVIEFGYLDSQALFSSMTNVRLDGYVYTVESLRTAYGLLDAHGVLALSFAISADWLGPKLFRMLEAATGHPPALYLLGEKMILTAPRDPAMALPPSIAGYQRALYDYPRVELATDDWPFLYLQRKSIPTDYLIAIGTLLGLSVVSVLALRRRAFGREDSHFALLGMGFLLLETKAISDCTLLFGTTWVVTLIVVTGVLLMVVAANLGARRLPRFTPALYAPLLLTLLLLLAVPREWVLGWAAGPRLAWALLAVPLPVFFAGLVFSTTFRTATDPAAAFGANLVGAMIGGFCEYLTMALGHQRLGLLVLAIYLASALLWIPAARSRTATA